MKTVLFVETGSGFGGSAVCLGNLIRCLDRSAYRPLVAYVAEGLAIRRLRQQGVELVPVHRGRMWWQLVRLIQRRRVDVVHANNELYSHAATILAAHWTRRPCVVHMRGIRPLTRRERWLIRYVDHFVIISQLGRRHYVQEGLPEAHSSVIHDGVDLELFDGPVDGNALRRSLGAQEDTVVVGVVSRLVPMKGHRDFLYALALVRRDCPRVRGVIVGGDVERQPAYLEDLRRQARALGLADSVVFTGWRDDVLALTAAFDIAAQASRYQEGFGTAMMEAMALGKPVVSTAVGGVPELVQDGQTGLLVPPGEPEALACALKRLAGSAAQRRRMGSAGRRRVAQWFDQRRLVKRMEALYEHLLGEAQGK